MTTQTVPAHRIRLGHTSTADGPKARQRGMWWKALIVGFLLWLATVLVTLLTRNVNLVPTVILLGSFLVPFVAALFAAERIRGFTAVHLAFTFAVAGICGVLGASLLESTLVASPWVYVLVGLIEEFVKLALLVIVGWRVIPKTAGQGALLGVAVGAGFAGFESAGYAFTAAITQDGVDIIGVIQTEVFRALLSPVGHMLWTAIIGAAIFGAASGRPRFRLAWQIPIAFVGASLLHALWDSLSQITLYIALLVSGDALPVLRYYGRLPMGLADEVSARSLMLYVIGLVIVTALGIGALLLELYLLRTKHAKIHSEATAEPHSAPLS